MWDSSDTTRLLVDHCVFTLGSDRVRGVKVLQTVQWGPKPVEGWIGKLQGKRENDEWLRNEIKAIAAVAAAVRAGQVAVSTSVELTAEAMLGRLGYRGSSGDLWVGIEFEDVSPPLERSRWCGALTGRMFSSREHQTAFCELLIRFATAGVPQELLDALRLDEFERASVAQLSEFAALCAPLHRKRLCDAFHLWTAMRHGMLFLTTDKQFRSELSLDFRWRTILPTEVVTMLNLPAVGLPVKADEVVDAF